MNDGHAAVTTRSYGPRFHRFLTEGDDGETIQAVFPLVLSLQSTRLISVAYSTANNSATAPDDYVAASGTVTFNPLETTQMVTITVNGDLIDEQDEERFFVNLSNPTHATLADARGIGTITDDDEPQLSIGDVTVSEGDNGETIQAVFPLVLSLSSTRLISVAYSTADSSATAPDGSSGICSELLYLSFRGNEESLFLRVLRARDSSFLPHASVRTRNDK